MEFNYEYKLTKQKVIIIAAGSKIEQVLFSLGLNSAECPPIFVYSIVFVDKTFPASHIIGRVIYDSSLNPRLNEPSN